MCDLIIIRRNSNNLCSAIQPLFHSALQWLYTAISRKVVAKTVHSTIPKGNMAYDQCTFPDTIAVESTFVAFL